MRLQRLARVFFLSQLCLAAIGVAKADQQPSADTRLELAERMQSQRLVVVTGASGHVGIPLIEELLKDPSIRVRALYWHHADRLQALHEHLQEQGFDPKRLETMAVDVLDADALTAAFTGAESVVHMAAVICIHNCPHDLEKMRQVNIDGTRNVLAAIGKAKVPSLVHFSSTHAYLHADDKPLAAGNGMVLGGDNYDASKAAAQKMVADYAAQHPEFAHVVIAPSGVIGRHDHADTDMWPLFERHSLVRMGPIPDGAYAFVDVRQVARIAYLALEQLSRVESRQRIKGQEFLLTGQHASIVDFVKTLQEVTGEGHCLNLGWGNRPLVVPTSWLEAIAPYCEKAAAMLGKKSLITSYSMHVLRSLPKGVDAAEFAKVERFFGEAAVPYTLAESFHDRYACKTKQAAIQASAVVDVKSPDYDEDYDDDDDEIRRDYYEVGD